VRGARALDGPAWPALLCDVADRLGLSDLPRLAASERVEIPFACGVWRVTIVLPAAAEGWSEERRRLVLFHELAHVRRRDLLGHMLGRVACAAYWFHPLAWIAARRLRAESERACDDLVLACGTRPSDYAGHLLEILSSARRTEALSAAVAMARRTEFEGRVLAILDPAAPRGVVGRLRSAALTAGLASVFLCVAALGPMRGAAPSTARAAEPEPAPQAPAQAQNPPAPAPPAVRAPAPERAAAPARAERRRDAEEDREEEEDQAEENESDAAPRPTAEQVALLTRVLRTDADASVRRSAAWALRSSGEPAAAALVAAVKGDADEGVREMAAWALADVRQADAAAALAAALKADQSEEVRAVAAWALGRQRQADRAALEAAAADRSARVREVAIWGLGNQRLEHAPAAVVTALGDADASVRTAAAWAVGQIGDPATAAPLRAAFKNEKDDEVRQAIFHAMVLMGERSPEVIAEVLQSKNPEMRALAVQVIGRGAGPWPWPWPRPDPRPYP
jgi:HEAT repeat protein